MRTVLATAASLAALIGFAEQALGCDCNAETGPPSLDDWRGAVTARLLSVDPLSESSQRATFTYRIRRVYKGRERYGLQRGSEMTIAGYLSGASCGLPQRRKPYGLLLYGKR